MKLGSPIGFLRSSKLQDFYKVQNIALWTAAITVGFIAVAYAKLFKLTEGLFLKLVDSNPYLVLILAPICFIAAWYVVYRFAPKAAGSGIPQIIAAHEMPYDGEAKAETDKLLSLKSAGFKIVSSLLCVFGGGAIGREGPTLQISASIFHFFGRFLKGVDPRTQVQTFIVAGSAAGLASAFNTPLGGIVYAIEELGGGQLQKFRTALLTSVIISGLMAQWMIGSYLFLGFPAVAPAGFEFLPLAVLTGLVSGLLGASFNRGLYRLSQERWKIKSAPTLALITGLCGLAVGGLFLFDHRVSGSGLDVITDFLFKSAPGDWMLVIVRILGTGLSYLSGAAGGIFSPSLAIGATIGAQLSSWLSSANPNLMVLLGMIGFLTGVTRTPFTSFILVIEMSDRHSAILPMMIAALVAQLAGAWIAPHSFYESVKERFIVHPTTSEESR